MRKPATSAGLPGALRAAAWREGPPGREFDPYATEGAWPGPARNGPSRYRDYTRKDAGKAPPPRSGRSPDPCARREGIWPGYSSWVPEDRTPPPAPKFRASCSPRDPWAFSPELPSGGWTPWPGPHLRRLGPADIPMLAGVLEKRLLKELAA